MDQEQNYFQCLLEEYRQCKSEILQLERYHWRVQMLFVPTILMASLGFYVSEVWAAGDTNGLLLSNVLENLFQDAAFVTLILWLAVVSILIQLHLTNYISREGRYIREWLAPEIDKMLDKTDVFRWERATVEGFSLGRGIDGSLQETLSMALGVILSAFPIGVAVVCVYLGIELQGETTDVFLIPFWIGVALGLFGSSTSLIGFVSVKILQRRMRHLITDQENNAEPEV